MAALQRLTRSVPSMQRLGLPLQVLTHSQATVSFFESIHGQCQPEPRAGLECMRHDGGPGHWHALALESGSASQPASDSEPPPTGGVRRVRVNAGQHYYYYSCSSPRPGALRLPRGRLGMLILLRWHSLLGLLPLAVGLHTCGTQKSTGNLKLPVSDGVPR